eukprot:516123-Hanusia_phi.AAC.7
MLFEPFGREIEESTSISKNQKCAEITAARVQVRGSLCTAHHSSLSGSDSHGTRQDLLSLEQEETPAAARLTSLSLYPSTDPQSSGNATITRLKSVREDVESTLVLTQSSESLGHSKTSSQLKSRIKLSFETYDTSKDGVLQPHEFKAALAGLGAKLSDTQVLVNSEEKRRREEEVMNAIQGKPFEVEEAA